jgi:cytochrome c oxidase assembly protein Cox11
MSLLKHLSLVLVIAICFFFALPAYASFCRNDNGVDGVKKSVEVYNCRDRKKIQKDGIALPFEKNDLGEIVCRLFKKTRLSANQNSG